MPSETSIESITDSIASMEIDQRHLLRLPPEIRLRIYSFLFAARGPILIGVDSDGRVYQPNNNAMRDHIRNIKVRLSGQFLRTCSQIYHEAWAYLFSTNRFEMLDVSTHNLDSANFTLPTRALMTKIDFLNRTNHRLNLSAIGTCFPSLQTIHIHSQGPGAHLCILAYELSRSLPCCDLRAWPTLELRIHVADSLEARQEMSEALDGGQYLQLNQNVKDVPKIKDIVCSADWKLVDLDPFTMPVFKLGSEVPELEKIVLHGGLMRRHLPVIEEYESTYADCAFELVREEPARMGFPRRGQYSKRVYMWKRKDAVEAAAVRGKSLEDTASLTRQWVPELSPEFVKAMADAGL